VPERRSTAGYAATQAAPGARFNAHTPAALAYTSFLRSKQLAVLSTIGNAPVLSQFDTVLNGFTAKLTPAQAAALSLNANVAAVAEDQLLTPATITTPVFLGLTTPGGIWSQVDGNGVTVKGENMVLGDVDLGIWPESPSYYDHVDGSGNPVASGGSLAYGPPPATWAGTCVSGDSFNPAQACNNKLIGARYYVDGFGKQNIAKDEYLSPRDGDSIEVGEKNTGRWAKIVSGIGLASSLIWALSYVSRR